MPDPAPHLARTRSFTRRARSLSPEREKMLAEKGAQYVVEMARTDDSTTIPDGFVFDQEKLFGRMAPLIVEIGPGGGEQLVSAAEAHPEWDFLAFEVWRPGIAKLVARAASRGVRNIRILEADAADGFRRALPAGSVQEVWTFFPDPWPKRRHKKRRLVDPEFAEVVARVLQEGGRWRLATDWADYAWQMRTVIEGSPSLVNPHAGARPDPEDPEPERGGFAPRYPGRLLTRFERRGREAGRSVRDVTAIKPAQE